MKTGLTTEQLKNMLSYDPETGVFTWTTKRPGRWGIKPGDSAGSPDRHGYILITIAGERFAAHRLAFLYVTGKWPEKLVDHIDGNPANNAFSNLRDVDQTTNMQNVRGFQKRADRSTPFLGVRRADSKLNPWAAIIRVNGKFRHIGVFKTPELAHTAYIAAKRQLHVGNTL